jgi:hypothetical protein
MALKTDLQRALGLEDKEIVINQLTQHIIIKVYTIVQCQRALLTSRKGHKKPQVVKFLEDNKLAEEREP